MVGKEKIYEQYYDIINSVSIVSKTDKNGIITFVNDNFCKLSGYNKDELIGSSHGLLRHSDMPDSIFSNLWYTIKEKKEIWTGIIKNKTKDGGYYWVKSFIKPIIDVNGNIIEYISIRTDLTSSMDEKKLMEDYRIALNESSLVCILNKEGMIKSINESFAKLLGYTSDNTIIGIKYFNFIGIKKGNSIDKIYYDVIEKNNNEDELNTNDSEDILGDDIWSGIIKNKRKNGTYVRCSLTAVPIMDYDNKIYEYFLIQKDVTDIEIAKTKLKKYVAKLKELDERKDDFLNIASHELRTPITSVKGYLSMMLDGDIGKIDEEAKKYLKKVFNNIDNLLFLVNDMLDITKIESGKIEFFNEEFNIKQFIQEDIIDNLKFLAIDKDIKLKYESLFPFLVIKMDKGKIKQILTNLIGNAIKFTPKGGSVFIKTFAKDDILNIIVEDSGIGIEESDYDKIFQKFGQVKNSKTRDINGTGLGLPIVKNLIEKMGGNIKVSSKMGIGTTFSITIPYIIN